VGEEVSKNCKVYGRVRPRSSNVNGWSRSRNAGRAEVVLFGPRARRLRRRDCQVMIWMLRLSSMASRGNWNWQRRCHVGIESEWLRRRNVSKRHVVRTRERWSCPHRHRPITGCLLLVPSRKACSW
jgi:hypothetical protein